MKLQLTKDKTLELNFGGGAKKTPSEITGIEMFSGDTRGFPAVRITKRKGLWHLLAADFVPRPEGEMPERWDDVTKQPTWELPKKFTSGHAAMAVNSHMATFAQASSDAAQIEMSRGLDSLQTAASQPALAAASEPGKRRFGIRRDAQPPKPQEETAPAPVTEKKKIQLPTPDEPTSANGRRFALRPLAEPGFNLLASLPEFQTLWLSRLLPEGKRPTVSSIQVAESALMASILLQPEFIAAEGNAIAVFIRPDRVYFAGYKNGEPVLWRQCPNTPGELAMRQAIVKTLGVGEDLVDAILNEAMIDPRSALEPFVHPILDQLELARAYLTGKHEMKLEKVFLMGLSAGAGYWRQYAQEWLHIELIAPQPFDGLVLGKGVEIENPNDYLIALGAAIAGTEATI